MLPFFKGRDFSKLFASLRPGCKERPVAIFQAGTSWAEFLSLYHSQAGNN